MWFGGTFSEDCAIRVEVSQLRIRHMFLRVLVAEVVVEVMGHMLGRELLLTLFPHRLNLVVLLGFILLGN